MILRPRTPTAIGPTAMTRPHSGWISPSTLTTMKRASISVSNSASTATRWTRCAPCWKSTALPWQGSLTARISALCAPTARAGSLRSVVAVVSFVVVVSSVVADVSLVVVVSSVIAVVTFVVVVSSVVAVVSFLVVVSSVVTVVSFVVTVVALVVAVVSLVVAVASVFAVVPLVVAVASVVAVVDSTFHITVHNEPLLLINHGDNFF